MNLVPKYIIIKTLADTLKIPEENIYIHKTKSSGIGSRGLWRTSQLCAQVALASYITKKPVKLVLSQDEQDQFNTLGVKTTFSYKSALSKTGRIIFLLWTMVSLLRKIERVFNHVWQVRAGRPFIRIITDYTAILLIIPVLMICSAGLSYYLSGIFRNLATKDIGILLPSSALITTFMKMFCPISFPLSSIT